MRTAKTLIRLGGCPACSESSLDAQSLCWFCHVAAQICLGLMFTQFTTDHVESFINFSVSRFSKSQTYCRICNDKSNIKVKNEVVDRAKM